MLSDKKKRQQYDLTGSSTNGPQPGQGNTGGFGSPQPSSGGYTFYTSGFPGATSSGTGGNQWFDPTSGSHGTTFSSASFGGSGAGMGGMGDIFDMMEKMFGGASMGAKGGTAGMGGNPFASFPQQQGQQQRRSRTGPSTAKSRARTGSGSQRPSSHHKEYPKTSKGNQPIIMPVEVTLEDLYSGRTKNLKVTDRVPMGAQEVLVEKTYKVDIKPGYKTGTKLKFPPSEEFPLAVEFEIKEAPHKYFVRTGDDLVWVCKLTARQVKKGVAIKVPLLDGTTLSLDSKKYIISHGKKVTFEGRGMPLSSKKATNTKKHGDLIVKFEVQ